MKYKLRPNEDLGLSPETTIDANNYSIDITLPLITTDEVALKFSKTITVISDNSETGFEVDSARELAVENYLIEINL